MKNPNILLHKILVYSVLMIMLIPLLATLLYSFSGRWGATLLPDSLTIKWYMTLFSDQRFLLAFARSLFICVCALLLSLLLIIPALFVIYYYYPALKKIMNIFTLLPFAIPPVVSSVGLLQIYAPEPFALTGTAWILIFTYFTIAFPFIYRSVANNFISIELHTLIDAAHLLGASTLQAFIKIILPNLKRGIMSAAFICFSVLLGEFVFATMLTGTRFETLPLYLYNTRQTSGHFTSALVMSYFLFVFLLTWLASHLGKQQ